jgi:hypothetical protein
VSLGFPSPCCPHLASVSLTEPDGSCQQTDRPGVNLTQGEARVSLYSIELCLACALENNRLYTPRAVGLMKLQQPGCSHLPSESAPRFLSEIREFAGDRSSPNSWRCSHRHYASTREEDGRPCYPVTYPTEGRGARTHTPHSTLFLSSPPSKFTKYSPHSMRTIGSTFRMG